MNSINDLLTEFDTDDRLAADTRVLTLPCGMQQSVTVYQYYWDLYDSLLNAHVFPADQLLAMVAEMADKTPYNFADSFKTVVRFAFYDIQKSQRQG
jgi:predicted DNA-binding ribbon-helix-helix protein